MESSAGIALALVGALGTAGQAIAIRLATRTGRMVDVLLINLVMTAAILAVLSVVLIADPVVTTTSILAFSASGIVSLMLGRAFYFSGIQRVGASRAEPIKGAMPLFATVFAVLALGEHVSGRQIVGIVLIVAGIALTSWEGTNRDRIAGNDVPWFGLTLPLLAAILFGVEPVFASIGFREGTTPLVGATIMTVTGSLGIVSYLVWRNEVPRLSDLPPQNVRWVGLSGLASVVSILGYYWALSLAPVGVVVPIVQTSPLFVVAFSVAFLRRIEQVTIQLVLSAVIIIAGAIIVTLSG